MTDDSLWEFTQDFVEGEQPVFVWSEPEPSKDEAAELAPLVKVVGSSFDKLVHDNATDVFTLVTHPRSKHCEMFMPTWKELATVSLVSAEQSRLAAVTSQALGDRAR